MENRSGKIVMGAYIEAVEAYQAIGALEEAGVPEDAIGVLMAEAAREQFMEIHERSNTMKGVATGGLVGGGLGALALGLTAASSIAIPGIGVFAAGALVAAATGAGVGGAIGGAVGGLIGVGLSELQADLAVTILQKGGVVVLVQSDDAEIRSRAERVLAQTGVASDTFDPPA